MSNEKLKQTVAAMGLISTMALSGTDDGRERPIPPRRPQGRCRDMRKKRKRQTVKESRRRNR